MDKITEIKDDLIKLLRITDDNEKLAIKLAIDRAHNLGCIDGLKAQQETLSKVIEIIDARH